MITPCLGILAAKIRDPSLPLRMIKKKTLAEVSSRHQEGEIAAVVFQVKLGGGQIE